MTHVCPECGVIAQYGEKDPAAESERRAEAAEAALAQEREAHKALVDAARAAWNSRIFTGKDDWQHYRVPNEKLNALASALAALDAPREGQGVEGEG